MKYSKVPPPWTGVLSKIPKPSRRSFGRGLSKKISPYREFFPIEYFFSYKLLLVCVICASPSPVSRFDKSFQYNLKERIEKYMYSTASDFILCRLRSHFLYAPVFIQHYKVDGVYKCVLSQPNISTNANHHSIFLVHFFTPTL